MTAHRKLDALAAERVMEWKLVGNYWRNADGVDAHRAAWDFWGDDDEPPIWSPSTDIAAAWELVERLRSIGWMVTVSTPPAGYTTWDVRGTNGIDRLVWHAETAAEAIAGFALRAVGVPEAEIEEAMRD